MMKNVFFGPEITLCMVEEQNFEHKGGEKPMRLPYTNAGQEVDLRTKNYMLIHGTNYATAMRNILNADEKLKSEYTGFSTEPETYTSYPLGEYSRKQIRDLVDSRVRQYLADHPGVSYVEGLNIILADDRDLKEAYARS